MENEKFSIFWHNYNQIDRSFYIILPFCDFFPTVIVEKDSWTNSY